MKKQNDKKIFIIMKEGFNDKIEMLEFMEQHVKGIKKHMKHKNIKTILQVFLGGILLMKLNILFRNFTKK